MKLKPTALSKRNPRLFLPLWDSQVMLTRQTIIAHGGGVCMCVCVCVWVGVHICLKDINFFSENNDSLSVWITTNHYYPILTVITDICRHYESVWFSSPHNYDDFRGKRLVELQVIFTSKWSNLFKFEGTCNYPMVRLLWAILDFLV